MILFFPKVFGAVWALLSEPSAGLCELWLGWRCYGWGLGESLLLGAALKSAPSQKSKSLLPSSTGYRHAWEQQCKFNVSGRQGTGLAGSLV